VRERSNDTISGYRDYRSLQRYTRWQNDQGSFSLHNRSEDKEFLKAFISKYTSRLKTSEDKEIIFLSNVCCT
jgi:hypothetical protein